MRLETHQQLNKVQFIISNIKNFRNFSNFVRIWCKNEYLLNYVKIALNFFSVILTHTKRTLKVTKFPSVKMTF